MEIISRTAEMVVENQAPQTAVTTILAHSFTNVNQIEAVFYYFLTIIEKIPVFFQWLYRRFQYTFSNPFAMQNG